MMKVEVDYPAFNDEMAVVQRTLSGMPHAGNVLSTDELQLLQKTAEAVYVDRVVVEYAVTLVTATRHLKHYGLGEFAPYVSWGSSPRGSINLVHAGRAIALLRGRNYVLPEDVYDVARDVLRHRVGLTYQALAEEVTTDSVVDAICGRIPLPRIDLAHRETA
jgi:MoxR-like ATPase